MCFERKILRKIFGPLKNNDGSYRIRYNEELEELIHHEHVVRYIKSQPLKWAGHVVRMGEDRLPHLILNQKLWGTRPKGRPRGRWIDAIEEDMRKMKVRDWKNVAQDRKRWGRIVRDAKAHQGL